MAWELNCIRLQASTAKVISQHFLSYLFLPSIVVGLFFANICSKTYYNIISADCKRVVSLCFLRVTYLLVSSNMNKK